MYRVVYVVPDPAVEPGRVRAAVGALGAAGPHESPVVVSTVTAIPRDGDGAPDEAALCGLPVPESIDPRPVKLADPPLSRLHLGDVVDLPRPWTAGPVPSIGGETSKSTVDGPSSRCGGEPLTGRPDDPATLVDGLRQAAATAPNRGVHVVQDGRTVFLSYPHLLDAASRTLTGLVGQGLRPADAAVLHTPSLVEHVVGLWACLLGGFRPLAVAQAPDYESRNRELDKLEHAWRDLDRPVVLSGGATVAALRGYGARADLDGLRVIDLDELAGAKPAETIHRPEPDEVAMLQLSSGSTGKSKIIQMTHRGIACYAQAAREVSHMRSGDVFVNWLPLDHVAGVVMYHLGPVLLSCDNVHVPTSEVLADPLLWLDLLQRFRAQHSWSPNFGYKLVADALARSQGRNWDLSEVRTLVNAGEQCTEPVMSRFVEAVAPFGVEERNLLLAWGMAETCTVIIYQQFGRDAIQYVSQAEPGRRLALLDEPEPGATTFLTMGRPAPGSEFRIAGPDGRTELPELHIGRLQGRSARITPGYLNDEEAAKEAFPDGGWFDTGDLAFVAGGRVTITGRAKEIIIVNGVHYHCHEIEGVVGAVDGVADGFVAAFGVPGVDRTERLGVVFVPEGELRGDTVREIRSRIAERFGLASALVLAVGRDSFDRTTSGKVQRSGMRARLLRGELDHALRVVELAEAAEDTMPDSIYRLEWTPRVFLACRETGRVLLVTDRRELGRALPGAVVVGPEVALVQESLAGKRSGEWTPDRIVLAVSYLEPPPPDDEDAVNRVLDICSSDVLALMDVLRSAGWSGELITLSRGLYRIDGSERACSPAALTEAIGATFALEQPDVLAWHLDLPGGDRDPESLADALTWVHQEPVVAVRDMPMVRGLSKIIPARDNEDPLPAGSCWLVTGGLGGVGRAVLGDLGLRLLVVGRSPARDLVGLGEDVRYARLDIADRDAAGGDALEVAVADAEQAWGAELTGVLHLAAEYQVSTLAETSAARWRAQARAKVEGTLAVARVLRRRPNCRLVAFSSLVSVLPAVGVGAYMAGNRFVAALCAELAEDHPVHCLVWSLWRGVGINAAHDYNETASAGRMLALSPAEGRALFHAAVRQSPGELLLGLDPRSARVRGRIAPACPLEGAHEPATDVFGVAVPAGVVASQPTARPTARPVAAARQVGIASVVHEALREVVPGGIAPDTPFYEAGIASLGLLRLQTLLSGALSRDIPLTTLFRHPTESALARHLSESAGAQRPSSPGAAQRDRRIAIIGMAARFPGAPTLDDYWANLLAGTVSTRRFDRAELLDAGLPASLVDDPDFVPVTGALDDIAGFDAELFQISPTEAALTDPQQRLFLQICHEALEHGGYARTTRRVGVYAGSGMNLYSLRTYLRAELAEVDPGDQLTALEVAVGNEPDFLATRVAYRLGLTGPALTVRTACSTSLVAVHLAASALLAGDAELAIAGAAALHVPRIAGYRYEEGSLLSRTGSCRPFDADADGAVGGNGVAAVLLKPLDAALADGDTVHAVLLGSSINNDGSAKVGYTSPSVAGQVEVIKDALASAGVEPDSIGYVEAHGTGTPIGDPIEIDSLREVFGKRTEPVLVGSVKANIGHLDSCAGMAGLLKAVLAVREGVVPPQANLRAPNPRLRLPDGLIELPDRPREWPMDGVRRAGVTALGFGGTNAHVVVEEPPPITAKNDSAARGPWVVPLSAREPTALAKLASRMADAVELAGMAAADVLTTLGAGRRRLPHRLVALGDTTAEVADRLRAGGSVTGVAVDPGPLVFAFTGQSVDCTGAATALMAHAEAAKVLRRCAEQHRQTWGVDLLGPLLGDPHEWTAATIQPAQLALQLAQAALLEQLDVRPDVVIGHSAGEYAALCVAGALSAEDAMHLAGLRGALFQSVADGGLLAVFGEPGDLPGLDLALRNGPGNVVLGGPPSALAEAERRLTERGVGFLRLGADRSFHTSAVEPMLDELTRHAAGLDWQPLRLPLVASADGTTLDPGTVPGPEHMRRHTRETADYRGGVEHLIEQGCHTFVELGPGGVLTGLGSQWPDTTWIPVTHKGVETVVPGLAELFCHGVEVDWAALAPGRRIPLPTYPFQLSPHWAGDTTRSRPGGTRALPENASPQTTTVGETMLARVRELTARQMGTEPGQIQPDVPFVHLGADSLRLLTMVRELEADYGVRIAARELFEKLDTPARLSAAITERMIPDPRTRLAPPGVTASEAAQPTSPAAPAVASSDGRDTIVHEQLELMGRFTRLMSEQVAMLSGSPPTV
jgi:acyl transferase domain-containing protein/acyl-CoA synthetase (AMP-forming)/AMP-acid ligase II